MARRKPLPADLPVQIERLDTEGLGTGRIETGDVVREVRLRNALPGETVQARILKRRRGNWFGNAQAPEASANGDRRPAVCAVFPRCGGCALQHIPEHLQLERKAAALGERLSEQGVQVGRWRAPITGPQFGYRRKARLGVRVVGDQVFLGFREAFASRVVDMTRCPVLDARLSALIAPLRGVVAALSVRRAVPQIEVAAGDEDTAVVLRHLEPLTGEDVSQLGVFARRYRVAVYTQAGGYDTVLPLPGQAPRLLSYTLPEFGLNLQFSPVEFTQVNASINRALVRHGAAPLRGCARVADLFCGIGNFSLALARLGLDVFGLEASASAIARAQGNAERNGVASRVRFAVRDLYGDGAADLRLPAEAEGLLLDPPRSGAGPHLGRWLTSRLRVVSYVSCNPRTFAQDARLLQDAGFALTEVGVFDMFPQTAHVETLGVFHRR
jgi:23S rRNA (uracil1939-C5)-methyltransferase